ncbi:hypothetical protein GA0115261_1114710, partial [Streptomyces sp. OspMP-M43]
EGCRFESCRVHSRPEAPRRNPGGLSRCPYGGGVRQPCRRGSAAARGRSCRCCRGAFAVRARTGRERGMNLRTRGGLGAGGGRGRRPGSSCESAFGVREIRQGPRLGGSVRFGPYSCDRRSGVARWGLPGLARRWSGARAGQPLGDLPRDGPPEREGRQVGAVARQQYSSRGTSTTSTAPCTRQGAFRVLARCSGAFSACGWRRGRSPSLAGIPAMEAKGGDGVEFVYRATADDFEVALRAWALRTGAGRFQAFAVPVASVGAPAVFGVVVGLSAPVLFGALVVCRRGRPGPRGRGAAQGGPGTEPQAAGAVAPARCAVTRRRRVGRPMVGLATPQAAPLQTSSL